MVCPYFQPREFKSAKSELQKCKIVFMQPKGHTETSIVWLANVQCHREYEVVSLIKSSRMGDEPCCDSYEFIVFSFGV